MIAFLSENDARGCDGITTDGSRFSKLQQPGEAIEHRVGSSITRSLPDKEPSVDSPQCDLDNLCSAFRQAFTDFFFRCSGLDEARPSRTCGFLFPAIPFCASFLFLCRFGERSQARGSGSALQQSADGGNAGQLAAESTQRGCRRTEVWGVTIAGGCH